VLPAYAVMCLIFFVRVPVVCHYSRVAKLRKGNLIIISGGFGKGQMQLLPILLGWSDQLLERNRASQKYVNRT
jgi:hypothetical protein